jgi:hypothetical protein
MREGGGREEVVFCFCLSPPSSSESYRCDSTFLLNSRGVEDSVVLLSMIYGMKEIQIREKELKRLVMRKMEE